MQILSINIDILGPLNIVRTVKYRNIETSQLVILVSVFTQQVFVIGLPSKVTRSGSRDLNLN